MNTENPAPSTQKPAPSYQCRHIFADGHRCGSPCLRDEPLCYFHHDTRRPIDPEVLRDRRAHGGTFQFVLPDPTDRIALQLSIVDIMQRIASNDLDHRRASLLLYSLQLAITNLPHPSRTRNPNPTPNSYSRSKSASPSNAQTEPIPSTIEDITTHPIYGTLAPITEINTSKSDTPSLTEVMLSIGRQMKQSDEARFARQAIERQQYLADQKLTPTDKSPQPQIIPNIQATADTKEKAGVAPGPSSSRNKTKRCKSKKRPVHPVPSSSCGRTRHAACPPVHTYARQRNPVAPAADSPAAAPSGSHRKTPAQ